MSFTKEAIKNIKQSGTFTPSSKFLIAKMIKDVNFNDAEVIVEYGLGDGCITQEILSNKKEDTVFIGLEINQAFYESCKAQFGEKNNIYILKKSATEISSILKKLKIKEVDCVISSLPLTLIDNDITKDILDKSKSILKEGGLFVQYQYSLTKYKLLKKTFGKVKIDFTAKNIPPAFVYRCQKLA